MTTPRTTVINARLWLLLVSAVLVLVAVSCGGDGDEDETPGPDDNISASPTATSQRATPTSQPAHTPTPRPTLTPSPTPEPANAIANAGNDLETRIGNLVGLNGSASSDPDGDPLTFRWTQVHGPDVTGGIGFFIGPTPSFALPMQVSTIIFELTVNDGKGDSLPDEVRIDAFEHLGNPGIFVDGNSGSDENGNGTRANPYATIAHAINSINGPDQDIHVMTLEDGAAYTPEQTLSPPTTTSMYGGYGPDWIRDIEDNRTRIAGQSTAVYFRTVNADAWFSGFDVTAADGSEPGESSFALRTDGGGAHFFVEDNILRAGNGADGADGVGGGTSYGIFVGRNLNVEVRRNEVFAGNGGAGGTGSRGGDGAAGKDGNNGTDGEDGGNAGSGGNGGSRSVDGGNGGAGGGGLIPEDGASGKGGEGPGGAAGIGDKVGAGRVGDGSGGSGGGGGDGGDGGHGAGSFSDDGLFLPGTGQAGGRGDHGGGGGGGGGGAGGVGLTGGGGAGAGGGGAGGAGGGRGLGGGASIGILLYAPQLATVEDNIVVAADGGRGGNGGAGGTGGPGGDGGVGGVNVCSFLGCNVGRSGDGGEGGGGGSGGIGGQGGGGAGGPSYGIVVGAGVAPTISGNQVTAGTGGNGGIGGAAGLGGSSGGGGGSTGGSGGCCAFLLETAGEPGTGGEGGWSFAVYDVDPEDDFTPQLTDNQLEAGTPGGGAAISGQSGQSGETNLSG